MKYTVTIQQTVSYELIVESPLDAGALKAQLQYCAPNADAQLVASVIRNLDPKHIWEYGPWNAVDVAPVSYPLSTAADITHTLDSA
jgi:hypothetical protein